MTDNNLETVWKGFRDINIGEERMVIRTCNGNLYYHHHAKYVDQKVVTPHDPRKAVNIPFEIIHAQLQRSENILRKQLEQAHPDCITNGVYKHNIVTANIGFVVSCGYNTTKTHTRRFITLPLMFPSERLNPSSKQKFSCNTGDVWDSFEREKLTFAAAGDKNPRTKDRNPFQQKRRQRAHERTISSGIQFNRPYHQNYPFVKNYQSPGPSLENDFHHSETAIIELLYKEWLIIHILNHQLSQFGVNPGEKIYAIILDMHSTNYMCELCVSRLYDVIHGQQRGFLKKWQIILEKNKYKTPVRGLKMTVRVTADKPPQFQKSMSVDQYTIHKESWMLNKGRSDNNVIFEADSQHLNLSNLNSLNDFFKRTVFVSFKPRYLDGECTEIALAAFVDLIRRVQTNTVKENNIQYEQQRRTDNAYKFRESLLRFIRSNIIESLPAILSDMDFRRIAQRYYLEWKPETFNTLFYI